MSKYYSIIAPAKLNLNLFVTGINKDGYHLLKSDVCFLELTDKIDIRFSNQNIFIQNNTKKSFIINPNDNLILETVKKFNFLTNWNKKFEIHLDKKIPIGAGLGGGSADAAATLILLRKLYNREYPTKKISLSTLVKLGLKLGSDIPACLKSKDLKLKGFGNKVSKNKISEDYYFLLINPNIALSTKEVFNHFSNSKLENNILPDTYFENIKIHNSLLSSAISLAPEIYPLLLYFKKYRKKVAYGMTGSGSTCFAIFKNLNEIYLFLESFSKYNKLNYFIWYGKKKNYNLDRIRSSKELENKV